ncbi:variable surface protein Vir4 [Plasmodium vivax Mauritania I]|uniref:Variable surface protein Vir4 n=1 Tax=Plasmodium vivax Mauritania I TaxID=1035515 RepID=A0A0J9TJG3_PLAVI|nr:variable surface protein Vir4 [Plasmodium vivax Mauritania I]
MGRAKLIEQFMRAFGAPEKELLSEDLYFKFKHDTENLAEYKEDCSSIKLLPKNDKVIELCTRVLRYLKTTYAWSNHENPDYDVCMLLNYWTYYRLNEIFGSEDTNSIYPAFAQIQRIWNTYNEKKIKEVPYPKCQPHFEIHKELDWEKRKEFCEYCLDYKTAYGLAQNYEGKYCQKYYEYFEKKADMFKYFEPYCSPSDKSKCPTFYDKCKQYDPNTFLTKLRCHEEMKKKKEDAAAAQQHGESAAGEPHSGLSTDEGSPDSSSLMAVSPGIAKQAGDVFLGVIVTSMTSGFLYRVSTIYFYYVTMV